MTVCLSSPIVLTIRQMSCDNVWMTITDNIQTATKSVRSNCVLKSERYSSVWSIANGIGKKLIKRVMS